MEQAKIDRINELARLAKERELSSQETEERKNLRSEYLAEWRQGAEATLERVVLVNPDGSKQAIKKKK